jgi:hypothetical protein
MLCRLMEPRASGLYAIIMPPGASNLAPDCAIFKNVRFYRTWTRRYVANVA